MFILTTLAFCTSPALRPSQPCIHFKIKEAMSVGVPSEGQKFWGLNLALSKDGGKLGSSLEKREI